MKKIVDGDYAVLKGEKTSYFFITGYISQIFANQDGMSRPPYYLACQICKSKVIDEETGYKCFKCD